MKPAQSLLPVLLLVPFLGACFVSRANVNRALDAQAVHELRPGESTADDVLDALGAPTEVVQLGRRSAWRYDHAEEKRAGLFLILVTFLNTDARADRVWVFFDEEDRLTHVGSTFEADDAAYAMPWVDLD